MKKYRVGYNIPMKNRRLKKRIRQLEQEIILLLKSAEPNAALIFSCRKDLITLYEQAGRFDSAYAVHLELAAGFMEAGFTQKAITEYHQVLKKSRYTANYTYTAKTLSTLGAYFQVEGDYKAALRFLTAALHAARMSGIRKQLFSILTELGNIYEYLDDDDQSLACYELAVEQIEKIGKSENNISDLPVCFVCNQIGSIYQKRDQKHCAYSWFKKAVLYAQNSISAGSKEAPQNYATAAYQLACLDFALGDGALAETRLSGLLQFCGEHELPVSEALATIQLVRIRLKSGSASGSLPLLQEQVDKIRKSPNEYPPECYMVFKLIGDHCKYFLKDTSSAERFYALYRKMAGGVWKAYLTE